MFIKIFLSFACRLRHSQRRTMFATYAYSGQSHRDKNVLMEDVDNNKLILIISFVHYRYANGKR